MEPTDALQLIENALRLAIRRVLGEEWIGVSGAPVRDSLEEKRAAEAKRRDGAPIPNDLLEYVETYHLTGMVLKNWERFQPVFDDKKRTEVYFGVVHDVRNTVAHSRTLMAFERDLLSGVAGQIRAQVAAFRGAVDESSLYYPLIERVFDSLGNEGITTDGTGYQTPVARLAVGEVVTFTASAFAADGNEVIWKLQKTPRSVHVSTNQVEVGRGDDVELG